MHITHTYFSQIGSMHSRSGQENQDALCFLETPSLAALILADGASACKTGAAGAGITCCATQEFLEYEGERLLSFPPQKQAYLLSRHICSRLGSAGLDVQHSGSTLQMLTVQKASFSAQILMIGDGMAARYQGQTLTELPGSCQGQPCLTTTLHAEIAARHWQFFVQAGDSVILATDGFLNFIRWTPDKTAYQALQKKQWETLRQCLCAASPSDDATFAALGFE